MHLMFGDAREFAEMTNRDSNLRGISRLGRIFGQLVDSLDYGTNICQDADRLMGTLWQIQAFVVSKKSFDEPLGSWQRNKASVASPSRVAGTSRRVRRNGAARS